MSTKTKTLPKSLHTVTVIAAVARRYMECERYPAVNAIEKALEDLGYSDAGDPYGLAVKTLAVLEQGAK
jgi:hypothetical protein